MVEIMKEKEILIKVEKLSKKYCKDLKTSLLYGVRDLFANTFRNKEKNELRPKEFWALKDIDFELRRGECLGLIGHNGAGKSTLLKILNGLIYPDEGKVTIKGKVGALIELGAGFNPILSGRENIYNNGAVLGFEKSEIDQKLDAIIDFAEIREFIDMPVQNYSSGMKVRLGFAVAAEMKPDVLLIDEVLAVGDLGFVLKCFKTIDKLLPNTAVVFVSHSMPMVARICNQVLLLDHGQTDYYDNDVGKAIDLYYSKFVQNGKNVVFSDNSIELIYCNLIVPLGEQKSEISKIYWRDKLKLHIKIQMLKDNLDLEFLVVIVDKEQRPVASLERNNRSLKVFGENKHLNIIITHNDIQLSKGIYAVNLAIRDRVTKEPKFRINNVLDFQLIHKEEVWEPFLLKSEFESVNMNIS